MSDSNDMIQIAREELISEATEEFDLALGLSLRDVEYFVSVLDEDRFKKMFTSFMERKGQEARNLAFPEDASEKLLTNDAYIQVASLVRAINIIKNDFSRIIGNYREFEEQLSNIDRRDTE